MHDPDDPDRCRLSPEVRLQLQVLSMDAGSSEDGNYWAPTIITSSLDELTRFHQRSGRRAILDVSGALFDKAPPHHKSARERAALQLRADWEERWRNVSLPLRKLIDHGALMGLSIGENLLWRNVSLWECNAIAHLIKETFPSILIHQGEAAELFAFDSNSLGLRLSTTPAATPLPAAVNYVSVAPDNEGSLLRHLHGENSSGGQRWLYENLVYRKLHVHQKVLVDFSRARGDADGAASGSIRDFFRWATTDHRVGGAVHLPIPSAEVADVGDALAEWTCYRELLSTSIDRSDADST